MFCLNNWFEAEQLMPPMHEKNEECLRRGLSDVFLHDFLARVYDTRERRGFALFNCLLLFTTTY